MGYIIVSDIYRWIIDQYRTALQQHAPVQCHTIDTMMTRIGHGWISDTTMVDPEQLVTSDEVEARFGLTAVALRHLVRRHNIPVQGKLGRSRLFRLGDILAVRHASN